MALNPLWCRNNLLFFVLMSVGFGKSADTLFKLKCESAVGVISQNTNIPCSIESQKKPVSINTVVLKRLEKEKPCFIYQPHENTIAGDPRFKVLGGSSLQLQNTAISDEGEYEYYIRTSLGEDLIKFTISVTAKYNNPVIKIEENGRAELHCTASGGYPAGTLHWFDQSNTNWTKSASLDITRGDDGLHTLSSTLRFESFDTLWAPFKCIVLNNKYQEEGRSSFILERKVLKRQRVFTTENMKHLPSYTLLLLSVLYNLCSGSDCRSKNLFVRIGENATIKCRSNADQDGVYLYLQKKETNTVTVLYYFKDGTLTLEDPFKGRVETNKLFGDFSVFLSNVRATDQGVYWCKFNKFDVNSDSEKTSLFIQPQTEEIRVTRNIPVTENIPVNEERCLFTVSWGVIFGQSVLILILVVFLVKLWHDRGNYTPKQQPSNGVYEVMHGHTKKALQNPAYESSQRRTRPDLI